MTEYNFQFIASQADEGIIFTPADAPNPVAPGNRAGWSSPSFKLMDSTRLQDLDADGGHWVGTVSMLPDNIVNMTSSYFPTRGDMDNVQLVGPIMGGQSESAIAIVGGGGKFAGARGEARCVTVMSDKQTPLYRYSLTFLV